MKATHFEFRFRFLLHLLLFCIAFLVPMYIVVPLDHAHSTWEWLAAALAEAHWMRVEAAFITLLSLAILFAVLAAWLRVWAAAYLSNGIVQSHAMHGTAVVAAGPYRYFRNPLYVGIFLHTLALALIMRPSGALFAIVTIGFFELRLIFAEEAFLAAKLGQSYFDYCARVPRLLPALRPQVIASESRPHWLQAVLGESYMIGVALSFAVLGWRYDGMLLLKCVLISFGVSLVISALLPRTKAAQQEAA